MTQRQVMLETHKKCQDDGAETGLETSLSGFGTWMFDTLRHQDLTHTRTSTIKTSRPEWEVIKAWWDKMTFKRDRVMKWKADSDFPGVLGGPINYRDRSELSRWWTADVYLLNDPPVLFLVHRHIFILKYSYWSTFTSHWLRGLALRHVLYRLKGEARPIIIIISIKLTRLALRAFYCSSRETKIFYCK